jgi:Flp pilus assembly protein protease CpaA
VRAAYLVAAAINALVAILLPHHHWPVNALMVVGLAVLCWTDRRPYPNPLHLYLLLAAVTLATAVGGVASARGDAMVYTFLGLCLVVALADATLNRDAADS